MLIILRTDESIELSASTSWLELSIVHLLLLLCVNRCYCLVFLYVSLIIYIVTLSSIQLLLLLVNWKKRWCSVLTTSIGDTSELLLGWTLRWHVARDLLWHRWLIVLVLVGILILIWILHVRIPLWHANRLVHLWRILLLLRHTLLWHHLICSH